MTNDTEFDGEKSLYLILEKAKKNDILKNLSTLAEKSVYLYYKRFGNRDYVNSISEEQFCQEFIDCVNHMVKENESSKKVFDVFKDDEERCLIIAAISGLVLK